MERNMMTSRGGVVACIVFAVSLALTGCAETDESPADDTTAPTTTALTVGTEPRTTAAFVPLTTEPPPPPVEIVSYANCDAVRAAGAAPIRRGDPGYSTDLDRDGDGIACE